MKRKILLIIIAIIIGVTASIIYELKRNELWIFEKDEVITELSDAKTSILVINPDYYNPLVSNNVYIKDLSKLVFEGLTFVTEDLNYENCLAKIIESDDDHKTYRIVLKNDIEFHNGNKLTSDDVIYTINKIQSLKEKSIYYYNVSNIETIKKVNNHEIKIILKEIVVKR
jgi:ABC-type transport system substrate-binding protein